MLYEVITRIFEILAQKVIPQRTAADLMVTPPRRADVGDTVTEIHNLLTRYNINAVPVLGGGDVVGIITRQVVEKALFHGLGDQNVEEYMNTDVESVSYNFV